MEEPIPLSFYVTVDPNLPREIDTPVVAWGDFVSEHPEVAVYEPSSMPLSRFYIDLIMGRSFALQFVTHAVADLECLVALALFLDRSLALHPKTSSFVSGINMVGSLGAAGMAHIDRDLARFILFLEQYTVQKKKVSQKEMEQKLASAIQLIRAYILEDQFPSLPPEQDIPKVLDTGTNGFVLAETPKPTSLVLSVVELYRMGHLRGLIFSGRHVLAFKKGKFLQFDLPQALEALNSVEPEEAHWYLHPGGVFLSSPPQGTNIPREDLVGLFLRV